MKVFYKEMEQSLTNKNGKVEKVTRIKQHNGKKGVEIINKNGKETRKSFKVKKGNIGNRKSIVTIVPILRALSRRNSKRRRLNKILSKSKKSRKTKRRSKSRSRSISRRKTLVNPMSVLSNNSGGKVTRRKKRKRRKKKTRKSNKGFWHNFLGV